MERIIRKILRKLKYKRKQKNLIKCGHSVTIHNSNFEGMNCLHNNVVVSDSCVGYASYISNNSEIYSTRIGKYCSIADHVFTCIGNHPSRVFVTTFPAFYYDTSDQLGFSFHKGESIFKGITKRPEGESSYSIIIGNDVWIGSHALIMAGIRIGDGAIVAAGAVVTKDVEPYTIVAGVPARPISKRFTESEIASLLQIKWWDYPVDVIKDKYLSFKSIKEFIDNNKVQ